jgi:hypothetical protein
MFLCTNQLIAKLHSEIRQVTTFTEELFAKEFNTIVKRESHKIYIRDGQAIDGLSLGLKENFVYLQV